MGLLHTNNVKVKKAESYCVATEMGLSRGDAFALKTMPEIPMSASKYVAESKKEEEVLEVISFQPEGKKENSKNQVTEPTNDQG